MTATVTVQTRKAEAVAAVPNAALRFRPVAIDAPSPGSGSGAPPAVFGTELKAGQGRVYVPSAGTGDPTEKIVAVGITDGRFTEVRSELGVGADVVTEQRDAKRPEKFLGLF
jgi:hypothetical protein